MSKKTTYLIKIILSNATIMSPDSVRLVRDLFAFNNDGIAYSYGRTVQKDSSFPKRKPNGSTAYRRVKAVIFSSNSDADVLEITNRENTFWCHTVRPACMEIDSIITIVGRNYGVRAKVVDVKKITEEESSNDKWPSQKLTSAEYLELAIEAENQK